ncbi:hypothetical protein EDC01DRAFT_676713 [Geopyxis carbonaria]|nr:hypothetical protein EDC01DRAFT_676713 [Geopyxis carbonaria]
MGLLWLRREMVRRRGRRRRRRGCWSSRSGRGPSRFRVGAALVGCGDGGGGRVVVRTRRGGAGGRREIDEGMQSLSSTQLRRRAEESWREIRDNRARPRRQHAPIRLRPTPTALHHPTNPIPHNGLSNIQPPIQRPIHSSPNSPNYLLTPL